MLWPISIKVLLAWRDGWECPKFHPKFGYFLNTSKVMNQTYSVCCYNLRF